MPVNSTKDGVDHTPGGRFTLFGAAASVLDDLPIFGLMPVEYDEPMVITARIGLRVVSDELFNGIF